MCDVLGSLFGTPDPTPTVQQQQLPPWYEDALKRLIAGTEAEVASKPYQFYDPTRRVADLTETQKAAIAATPEAAGAYMPGLSAAFGQAAQGARTLPQVDISQYMSPYQQAVTDISKRETIRDYEKGRPQLGFQAAQRGAFGGARHGVQEAEAERNLMQRLSDIQTQGSQAAFTQGTNFLQNEMGRQLQAAPIFQNLGTQSQALGLGGLSAITQAQAPLQNIQQQLLDTQFQEYMRGQGYGMNQMNQLSGILRGTQAPRTEITTGGAAQSSPAAQLAGIGLGAYGLYNMLPK